MRGFTRTGERPYADYIEVFESMMLITASVLKLNARAETLGMSNNSHWRNLNAVDGENFQDSSCHNSKVHGALFMRSSDWQGSCLSRKLLARRVIRKRSQNPPGFRLFVSLSDLAKDTPLASFASPFYCLTFDRKFSPKQPRKEGVPHGRFFVRFDVIVPLQLSIQEMLAGIEILCIFRSGIGFFQPNEIPQGRRT